MVKDLLLDVITEGEKKGAEYVDIRFQDKYAASLELMDGELNSLTGSRQGCCIRTLVQGSWGLTSTNIITKESLLESLDKAFKLAHGSAKSKDKKIQLKEVDVHKDSLKSPRKKSLLDVSVDEKIKLLLEASKIQSDYPFVKSLSVNYSDVIDKRIIFTSEGTQIEWEDMKPTLMAYAVAIEQGKMASGYTSWSHTCGAEFFELHPPDTLVKEACEKAVRLVHAPLPKGGVHNILLDPQLVGVLAHEAIGHTAEADLVQAGSFTKGKLGQKVCHDDITLVDQPFIEGSNWMGAGWLPYDDEGVKGKRVEIIKNGIMHGYLTNRAYAHEMGVEATGNARAYTFLDEPIVRMRNTFIEPGTLSLDELAEVVGTGYVLGSLQNGQADSSGEFMFGAVEAYAITKGEITDELYQGPVLSGNAFSVLSNILGIGKDFEITLGSGFCGKEQPAKVDAGGPWLALRATLAGGK